jgi:hypothetical protein
MIIQNQKKASLETKEILELILAVAVLIVIGILLFNMFGPKPNQDKEAAKSLFEALKKAVSEADAGGSEFKVWGNDNIRGAYFGNIHIFSGPDEKESTLYKSKHNYDHAICMCYIISKTQTWMDKKYDKEGICDYCTNLNADKVSYTDVPGKIDLDKAIPFLMLPDKRFKIVRGKGEYIFYKLS